MSSSESKQESDAWNVLAHLWQLTQSVLDESAPALEAIGLSPKAFFLLTTVEEHPFPAELARLMHLPPPTVTYLVKQMEAKGFLKRTQSRATCEVSTRVQRRWPQSNSPITRDDRASA